MKKLRPILFVVFFFSIASMVNAQETKENGKVNKSKSTINATDKIPKKVVFNDLDYYVIDGIWYGKFKNKYVLRQAPEGARIDFLPKNGKIVILVGKKYYKCKGVFYKKTKDGLYQVARP